MRPTKQTKAEAKAEGKVCTASSKGSQACIDQTQPGDQKKPQRVASEKMTGMKP
jgi:hypothetical protein